jgi:hypothetical protein
VRDFPSRITAAVAAFILLCVPSAAAPAARAAGADGVSGATAPVPHAAGDAALLRVAARSGLRSSVLRLALKAHARATAEGHTSRPILTVIDYSLRSRVPRLWVLDLDRQQVLAHELVAHGNGTGSDSAHTFSNRPGSNQSNLGTLITGETYTGKHGRSLRLRGIDPGLNDNAEARAIVVHGAEYVNPDIGKKLGRLGRSQGCPALGLTAAQRVIDLIRGGTVLFAYYPSPALEQTLADRTLTES